VLTTGDETGMYGVPSWSPDGTRILYRNATSLMWMYANGYGATPIVSALDPSGWSWSG